VLVQRLVPDEEDCGRVEGDVGELGEGREVVLARGRGGADPADGTGDDEGFDGVVREAGGLAFRGLVEDVCAGDQFGGGCVVEGGVVVLWFGACLFYVS